MKKPNPNIVIPAICLVILGLFFLSIIGVTVERKILPQKTVTQGKQTKNIQWEKQYPFQKAGHRPTGIVQKLTHARQKIQTIQNKVNAYSSSMLYGYQNMVELSHHYEKLMHWNLISYHEQNAVTKLPDGYLTFFLPKLDMTAAAHSLTGLAEFCKNRSIGFLYVQAPYKISKHRDPELSGIVDFTNQNADELIEKLRANHLDVLDLRDLLDAEFTNPHALFFKSDHHWLPETGLWASQKILRHLAQHSHLPVQPENLAFDQFYRVRYPKGFLGFQGKKITMAISEPDDFTLIYPKYPTRLHYEIPDIGLDTTGDFSVTYDMNQLDVIDYYGELDHHTSPYAAYNYGERPLVRVQNLRLPESPKVLFIHDSFGTTTLSFMAMGIQNLDALDLRAFTGSVESYIEREKPAIVIFMYNPGLLEENIDWDSHKDLFDLR